MFPLLLLSIIALFYKKKEILKGFKPSLILNIIFSKTMATILFLLVLNGAIILPYSKGNILAFNFFIIINWFIILYSNKSSIINKIFIIIMLSSISYYVLNNLSINYFFFSLFSDTHLGNIKRYEQIPMILNDSNILGNGLGATIKGYSANDTWSYGFETTYLNLVHKFGILSTILFLGYIATIYIPIIRLINKRELLISSASLGMMGFIFPAIGNPILYSPVACILHCSSLYLMQTAPPVYKNYQ